MSKNIEKNMQAVEKVEKKTANERYKIQCRCSHKQGNDFTIVNTGRKNQAGRPIYKCKQCRKEVILQKISDQERANALEVVSQMCDIIKMNASQKDERIYEMAMKTQATLPNLEKAFVTTLDKVKNIRKSKDNRRNSYDGGYSGPQTIGIGRR